MVNELGSVSPNDKAIELLEEQLTYMKRQNEQLSIKLDQSISQNKALAEQIRQLTKPYTAQNPRNPSIKHQMGKFLYLKTNRLLTILSTQKNKARQLLLIPLSVNYIRKTE